MSESKYDDFENYNDVVSRWACQTMITLNCFWMSQSNYDDFENYNDVASWWECHNMTTLKTIMTSFLDESVKLWQLWKL